MSDTRVTLTQSPNRIVGSLFGAVYLAIGALGFAYTGGVGFLAPNGGLILGIFEVNPLHNIAHLVIGAALLIAGITNSRAARATNGTVGVAYLALGIVGFFLAADPDSSLNFLALNMPDHFLHLVSAVILGGVALGADQRAHAPRVTAV
jgi:hypothetical protein